MDLFRIIITIFVSDNKEEFTAMDYKINDTILSLIDNTPDAIQKGITARVKERRLESAMTQKDLAARADIPLPTYRRFERTGDISLRSLIMIGIALGMSEEFGSLFAARKYGKLDDVIRTGETKKRKRGKSNG